MKPFPLAPLNDFVLQATLKEVDATTGQYVPVTSGSVTAFLATSNASDAAAADPSLVATAVHVKNGRWLITFDAATLTKQLLSTLFASATPYCIITRSGGFRRYVQLAYSDSEAAA
jgi:hypothetical protein